MDMNRRQFFKACAAGLGGRVSLCSVLASVVLAETRNFSSRAPPRRAHVSTARRCGISCMASVTRRDRGPQFHTRVIPITRSPRDIVSKRSGLLDGVTVAAGSNIRNIARP